MKRKLLIALVSTIFVLLLAVILIPNFIHPRHRPWQNSCAIILRQLDGAKQQWSLEFHKTTNAVPTMQDLLPFIKGPVKCPEGGAYILGPVGEPPKCSIGVRHAINR